MQTRHKDRWQYFQELAHTSLKYFIPYIQQFLAIGGKTRVLEIGCGEGGNLLPLAQMGCHTIGVDIAAHQIANARTFFAKSMGGDAEFIADDIFNVSGLESSFDLIICHDILEHIEDKSRFLLNLSRYLKPKRIVFMSFPPWQMPFGGCQQICRNPIAAHLPYIHLLPDRAYRSLMKMCGEYNGLIEELLSIKQTGISLESFEKSMETSPLKIADRKLWFINPHYETKFHLPPLSQSRVIAKTPFLHNFLTTSCLYILASR